MCIVYAYVYIVKLCLPLASPCLRAIFRSSGKLIILIKYIGQGNDSIKSRVVVGSRSQEVREFLSQFNF